MIRMTLLAVCASLLLAGPVAAGVASDEWSAYLDYAYVYSSADAPALRERLDGYSAEAGISLERYILEYFEALAPFESEEEEEVETRRRAVAYFLDYLARGESESLGRAVGSVRQLEPRLDRHENKYWYHYIQAHEALERGYAEALVEHVLELWIGVVVPMEGPYETLETLSLSDAPNSGFVSALPFLYENIARLVLLRSQEMGVDRDLDPLGAIVRMLADGRVGVHPDVIPPHASSRAYLERIIERLEGPESDDGSLTFTLALFEATKNHEAARGLLASQGLNDETVKAMQRASGSYETALNRAATVQGRAAVYTRVLRQIGELYAARQRLGVDPEIDMPFSIEGAIEVYADLRLGRRENKWKELGYRKAQRQDYVLAMRALWEEIQETSLNAADYYLAQSLAKPELADEHAGNAARVYTRYLSFFHQFATADGKEAVPDSAYFAAFEAARGVGDAYLTYAREPSPAEVELATQRYRSALMIFPFDHELWPALTAALGRHGRESEFPTLVRPIADGVVRSGAVNNWIEDGESMAFEIAAVRRALADSLVVMYLGFAEAESVGELEQDLAQLYDRYAEAEHMRERLELQRDAMRSNGAPPAAAADEVIEEGDYLQAMDLAEVARRIADQKLLLTKLDQQIQARSRALPLYRQTLETQGMTSALRTQRDHPVHILLRRMYHESRLSDQSETDRRKG